MGNSSEDALNSALQTGDKGSGIRWRQHPSDIFRQLQIMFPLKVRDAFVVVTKCFDNIYPHCLSNSQV